MAQSAPPAPDWLSVAAPSKDRHTALAYACYFALGSGILAPWNAFITAADYFESVFPGRHMDRLFTIAYLPACLLVLGLVIKFNNLPNRPRILTSFASFVVIMLLMPLIDVFMLAEGSGSDSALAVVLLAVVTVGLLDGMSQGAIFGDASDLPPRYTHAVVGGTASSGVIICLLRIATKASLPDTTAGLRQSTGLYFGLSGAICMACLVIYWAVLPRLDVVQHYKKAAGSLRVVQLSPQPSLEAGGQPISSESDVLVGPALDDEHALFARHGSVSRPSAHALPGVDTSRADHSHSSLGLLAGELHIAAAAARAGPSPVKHVRLSWQRVVVEAWQSILALFLLYVVTLSIFPGVLAEDVKSDLLGDWYPIVLITVFNVCDLLGKNIPFPAWSSSAPPRTLLTCSLLRFLFVPAFFVAGTYAGSAAWLMALLTISLGFSNGFLTALVMTLAPATVAAGEADLVEEILVFSLVAGLTVGAVAGWLWLLV